MSPQYQFANQFRDSCNSPLRLSDLHFAVGAGNPDLFRARLAGGFPIHGPVYDVPHLGEPPVGADLTVPRRGI